MKYFKTQDVYKNSTGTNILDKNRDAYSYGWWKYYDCNTRVFNHSTYSTSTSKHQINMRTLLRELGLDVGLTLYNTSRSLANLSEAIEAEITSTKKSVEKYVKMQQKMKDPTTNTYINRQYKIIEINKRLLELETYKGYLQRANLI